MKGKDIRIVKKWRRSVGCKFHRLTGHLPDDEAAQHSLAKEQTVCDPSRVLWVRQKVYSDIVVLHAWRRRKCRQVIGNWSRNTFLSNPPSSPQKSPAQAQLIMYLVSASSYSNPLFSELRLIPKAINLGRYLSKDAAIQHRPHASTPADARLGDRKMRRVPSSPS